MIYKVGMLCKHFKGKDLLEKNIYRIERLGVSGKDIDTGIITYTGEEEIESAENLVIYSNIFQRGKLFAREYNEMVIELSEEEVNVYNQRLRVEPLTDEEIKEVSCENFVKEKEQQVALKYGNLREESSKYPEIVLSTNGKAYSDNFDPEYIANTYASEGFVEKFLLTEEEREQVKKLRKEMIKK